MTDPDKFIERLKTTNEDVFIKILKLVHNKIPPSIVSSIMKSWIAYNDYDIIKILSKIKYAFEGFAFKEKFKFYDFCVQRFATTRKTLPVDLYESIFGIKSVTNMNNSIDDITIEEVFDNPKGRHQIQI